MCNNWNVRSNVIKKPTEKKLGETRKEINYVRGLKRDFAVSLENNHRGKYQIGMSSPQRKTSGCTQGSSPEGRREDLQKGRGGIPGKEHALGIPSWYPGSRESVPSWLLVSGGRALLVS